MSFLATLGKILSIGIAIFTGVSPLLTQYLGAKAGATVSTVVNDLTSIGSVVLQAEALLQGSGTGAQKLAAATPLVANIIKTSEMVSGHEIANESLFTQGATKITSGVADILNSLSAKNIKSANTNTSSVPTSVQVETTQAIQAPATTAAPAPSVTEMPAPTVKSPLALT